MSLFWSKGLASSIKGQYYNAYTTNVYGRQAFKCYSCTNDNIAAGSRGQATGACGFGNDFNSGDASVKTVDCYTFCSVTNIMLFILIEDAWFNHRFT